MVSEVVCRAMTSPRRSRARLGSGARASALPCFTPTPPALAAAREPRCARLFLRAPEVVCRAMTSPRRSRARLGGGTRVLALPCSTPTPLALALALAAAREPRCARLFLRAPEVICRAMTGPRQSRRRLGGGARVLTLPCSTPTSLALAAAREPRCARLFLRAPEVICRAITGPRQSRRRLGGGARVSALRCSTHTPPALASGAPMQNLRSEVANESIAGPRPSRVLPSNGAPVTALRCSTPTPPALAAARGPRCARACVCTSVASRRRIAGRRRVPAPGRHDHRLLGLASSSRALSTFTRSAPT